MSNEGQSELRIPQYCESHFEWAKQELKKEEARHTERKSQIIKELEERLERSKRVPVYKIAALVGHILEKEGYVSDRYVRMVSDEKYKEQKFKNKENKAEPETLPPKQQMVVEVTSRGSSKATAPEASKHPQSSEVEELKKKLAEANKVIQVQKQTIDDIAKAKPVATIPAVSPSVKQTAKLPDSKIDTSEQKARQRVEELETKLAPFERPVMVDIDESLLQKIAHSGRLPLIVEVLPASHKVSAIVDERRLKSL